MAAKINLDISMKATSPDDPDFGFEGNLSYRNMPYDAFVQMQLFGAKSLVGMTEQLGGAAVEKKAGKPSTSPTA